MQEEELVFCQSCSMPMTADEQYGTEADGSKSADYCCYCYKDGAFTAETDLEGMIAICIPPMLEAHPEMGRDEVESMMRTFLPRLKRWRKN